MAARGTDVIPREATAAVYRLYNAGCTKRPCCRFSLAWVRAEGHRDLARRPYSSSSSIDRNSGHAPLVSRHVCIRNEADAFRTILPSTAAVDEQRRANDSRVSLTLTLCRAVYYILSSTAFSEKYMYYLAMHNQHLVTTAAITSPAVTNKHIR